jgi:hypothetical protein
MTHDTPEARLPHDRPSLLRERSRCHLRLAAIDAALAAVEGTPDTFTTRALPPGVSRRAFHERCRRIPGAHRSGRAWVVSAADWFVACGTSAATPAAPSSAPWTPALGLAQAGLRLPSV